MTYLDMVDDFFSIIFLECNKSDSMRCLVHDMMLDTPDFNFVYSNFVDPFLDLMLYSGWLGTDDKIR